MNRFKESLKVRLLPNHGYDDVTVRRLSCSLGDIKIVMCVSAEAYAKMSWMSDESKHALMESYGHVLDGLVDCLLSKESTHAIP